MELLNAKRVQSFRSIREEEVLNLIESISMSEGFPVNLSEKVHSMMNRVISRAAFGKECKYEKEFISLVKEIFSIGAGFHVSDLFPSLKFLSFVTGMKPALEKIHTTLDKILDDIIEDKMQRSSTSASNGDDSVDHNDDIVDVLLKLRQTGRLDFDFGRNHIKAVTLV
jgi:cytochrome P450